MSVTAATAEPLIVSVSGLRGVVGHTLTPEVAVRYAAAFVAGLPPGPVVIGRDGRANGPPLAAALVEFLTAAGRDVIDCGPAATPTIGVVGRGRSAAGGIQISASHNPARYNGIKLFSAAGRVLDAAAGRAVRERFDTAAPWTAAGARGRSRTHDAAREHVNLVSDIVDVPAIRQRRLRVWIDCCHGAGSRAALPLLERLGCDTVVAGGDADGRYEHDPEPTAANLAAMLPRVAAAGADVGFFLDPDADRLAIADPTGRYLGEEATLALAVDTVLSRRAGPIVVNCSTSGMAAALAARHGAW